MRAARNDQRNQGNYFVPTIKGYRGDLHLVTYSAWEANVARVILYFGREMVSQVPLRLNVPELYKDFFNSDVTDVHIDFITRDRKGNIKVYEIMAHPLEFERDWIKLELSAEQYGIKIVPITSKFYKRLENKFRDKINLDSKFSGWETASDNIINPEKYDARK